MLYYHTMTLWNQRWPWLVIILFSVLFTVDLFLHVGEPATFDGPIHITNIAMYRDALMDGDLPVSWADGFANYGLPTPLLSQQLTSYLGALIAMFVSSVLAFKVLFLLATLVGSGGMYVWLKRHTVHRISALAGSLLFALTAYRITDLYIRGALPELFGMSILPWVLAYIERFVNTNLGWWRLFFVLMLLLLAHPFIFFLSMLLVVPYGAYLVYRLPDGRMRTSLSLVVIGVLAVAASSWYLMPLLFEIKYFVISRNTTQLVNDQFLRLGSYFVERWPYFYQNDVFVRGNVIQFGLIESVLLFLGPVILLSNKRFRSYHGLVTFSGSASLFLVFMTTKSSLPLYEVLPLLHGIQFPWRMLTVLIAIPPLYVALLLDLVKYRIQLSLVFLLLLVVLRVPQLYGKNYVLYPAEHYTKTIKNLHFDSLNTIWIGNTQEYSVQPQKGAVIEGSGEIVSRIEKNSERNYVVHADEPVRMVDYTFYFPGWKVYVDGDPAEIQFQDVNYRGVITYIVPAGDHRIRVVFEPTKVRWVGYVLSGITLALVAFMVMWQRFGEVNYMAWGQRQVRRYIRW